MGRAGSQVVSVLAFYLDNTKSSPTEAYRFFFGGGVKFVLDKNKNKQERGWGLAHFLKETMPPHYN